MRRASADRNLKRTFATAGLLLLLLAGASQAHWADVRFRNLTVAHQGGDDYLFSVLLVNTEGAENWNNVSFDLAGPLRAEKVCRQFVSLPAFERRTLECRTRTPGPGRYILVFQSERIQFDVGGLVPGQPSPSTPAPTPRSPGFEALGALAAIAVVFHRGRGRGPRPNPVSYRNARVGGREGLWTGSHGQRPPGGRSPPPPGDSRRRPS